MNRDSDTETTAAALADIAGAVRVVEDFPQPGIAFRDITPLIANPALFARSVDLLAERARARAPDVLLAVEARGFLFGAPLALTLCLPLVPARKAGKLPGTTHRVSYGLEYGSDSLELHSDALHAGQRVLIIDDLLATGGTVAAAAELAAAAGAHIVGALFLIELAALGGRARLAARDVPVDALFVY